MDERERMMFVLCSVTLVPMVVLFATPPGMC